MHVHSVQRDIPSNKYILAMKGLNRLVSVTKLKACADER
jgi:hypothetical protein